MSASATRFINAIRNKEGYSLAGGIGAYEDEQKGQFSVADKEIVVQEIGDRSHVENLQHAGEVVVECRPYWPHGRIPDLPPSLFYKAWEWGKYLGNWQDIAEMLDEASSCNKRWTRAQLEAEMTAAFGPRPNARAWLAQDRVPGQIKRGLDDLWSLVERSGMESPRRDKARGLLRELQELLG
jgi:hypothetical protein